MVAPPEEVGAGGQAPRPPGPRPSLGRTVRRGCLAGLVLTAGLHTGYVLLGPNFHTVIPDAVYRCSQPSGPALERLVRARGIRTVINLRGCCDPLPWYLEQSRVTNRLGVSQEDLGFSAARLPSPVTLRQLVEVLSRSEYPVLFHCHKGADRSGMASAVALLLLTDAPLAEARRQLSFRYGHLPLGRTGNIDRFFDLYQEWLAEHGLGHSAAVFRRWAETDYCPGECRCTLEMLTFAAQPGRLACGRPAGVRVRCHNTSVKPWHLNPAGNAGVHLAFALYDDEDRPRAEGRAGLFFATVPPGGHIDLTVPLPGLVPGGYELRLDMVDEQHASFLQTGSEPLVWRLEVP
jgi:Tyrosine phosphatase family